MYSVANITKKNLLTSVKYGFAGLPFGKKRIPTKSDLDKYDVVVVGANLGNILATHLDAVMGEKAKIMVAFDNQVTEFNPERVLYEQGHALKKDTSATTKGFISKNNAHTDLVSVEKYDPENSQIVLKNGRTIQYENLVIAAGQQSNYKSIQGFYEAWHHELCPVYTNADHPQWKTTCTKVPRHFYNFNGGEAIFYIPPTPFAGEIENYNFLIAKEIWDMHAENGRISWDTSKVTIINANRTFCQHFDKVDTFLKEECQRRNINVVEGVELVSVNKDNTTATFKDVQSGETHERLFGNLYAFKPYAPHANIAEAGLADSNGALDVNPNTLQHTKYSNIFGLGDVTNVPTTKTFYAGLAQVGVLRHNLEKKLNNHDMNARYDGFSEAPLYISQGKLSWVSHLYDGVEKSFDTGAMTSVNYALQGKFGKESAKNILKFKNWGPPYYKLKKTFETTAVSANTATNKV